MKLLIAEDDPVSRVVLEKTVERLGHTFVSVDNGRRALEAVERDKDLRMVLTDWAMPEMDGLELCRRIRRGRRFRYTYVLLITARSGKQSYLEALDAGVDDFITKPVEVGELRARLLVGDRLLGRQAEMQQLHGLLSICAYCKRIRESEEPERWVPIESYVSNRANTSFSQDTCPNCQRQAGPR